MKMTVTSVQRTFTATLKTILPYNLFLLYLYKCHLPTWDPERIPLFLPVQYRCRYLNLYPSSIIIPTDILRLGKSQEPAGFGSRGG